jgi:hypothetical protein
VVIVASMSRSGSMWTYNVTRELISLTGKPPLPHKPPQKHDPLIIDVLNREPVSDEVYCLKTHSLFRSRRKDVKFICTYRDVRDSMLSFQRFMHCNFERALEAADSMMEKTDFYFSNNWANMLPIRYDNIVSDPLNVLREIASFLGIRANDRELKAISERYSRESVRKKIREFSSLNANRPGRVSGLENSERFESIRNLDGTYRLFDRKTNFQTNHITSKTEGEWREVFSEDQKKRLLDKTSLWLLKYGFPL